MRPGLEFTFVSEAALGSTAPAFIGLLGGLDLGSQVMIAGTLFLMALYVLRIARLGSTIAAVSATAVQIAVAICLTAAVAIGLGWIDPQPTAFIGDVFAGVRWILELPIELLEDLARRRVSGSMDGGA